LTDNLLAGLKELFTHSAKFTGNFRRIPVIPASAGIQVNCHNQAFWIPACAGMTVVSCITWCYSFCVYLLRLAFICGLNQYHLLPTRSGHGPGLVLDVI
jgi:hypothetical protein